MHLHYKNPTWVNSTQIEPGLTLGNFFRSVNRASYGQQVARSHGFIICFNFKISNFEY